MGRTIMKTPKQQPVFGKKLLALVVLLGMANAYADDDEVAALIKNESTVSAGAGFVSGNRADRSIFGQYNGLRDNDSNLLLDVNIIKLDDATGLWTKLQGHDLGLDDRELSFSQNKQGDWKYSVEYNEITHHDMRTINTGLQNAGSLAPKVMSLAAPGTGADLNLQLQRQAVTLSAAKWITPNLLFAASFKNEDKKGAQLSGAGLECSNIGFPSRYPCGSGVANPSGAILVLPDPVNTNTKQIDVKLDYSGDKFLLSGGYYGSFFSDANGALNPSLGSGLYNPNGTPIAPLGASLTGYLTAPIALPPNNQAQQLYVSGNYAITPTTHSTFKYAYTHATQNQSFGNMGLAGWPAGVASLGGGVDTNLLQFGVTARPLPQLGLLANLRYEDKDDKTPLATYNLTAPGAGGMPYTNNYSSSATKLNGKLEASYQLPDQYRAILGVDYASVKRAAPPNLADPAATDFSLALGGLRDKTWEVSYRAELRRTLSDDINGAISYVHSQRNGDEWMRYNTAGTLPMTMLDRTRDKFKLAADWMPTNKLSVQFNLEGGKDSYTGPNASGLRDSGMAALGIDAALNLSEKWKLTGFVNQSDQTQHVSFATLYLAELDDINTSMGLGVAGKPTGRLDVGGNLTYMSDINRYNQSGIAGLPDVTYRVTNLKLFGKYALEKNTDVRLDIIHQHTVLNEWTWGNNGTPFTYSDNTTVAMQPDQSVTFLGASYVCKFR
jgi:MtrB/PioB family decaheme-associated outer membrane protein